MFKWFKKLRTIVVNYDRDRERLYSQIKRAEKLIIDRTEIHADIHFKNKSKNTAIMIGRYRGRDYVQTFDMDQHDFESIIGWLRNLKQQGYVRYIDAPPVMDIVIDKEREQE